MGLRQFRKKQTVGEAKLESSTHTIAPALRPVALGGQRQSVRERHICPPLTSQVAYACANVRESANHTC